MKTKEAAIKAAYDARSKVASPSVASPFRTIFTAMIDAHPEMAAKYACDSSDDDEQPEDEAAATELCVHGSGGGRRR